MKDNNNTASEPKSDLIKDINSGKQPEVVNDSEQPKKVNLTPQEMQLIAQKQGTLIATLLQMLENTEKVIIASEVDGQSDMAAEVSTIRADHGREGLVKELIDQYWKLKTLLN